MHQPRTLPDWRFRIEEEPEKLSAIVLRVRNADTSGDIVERYLFDPYGKRTILDPNFSADSDNTSDFAFMHGHQGGKYDSVLNNQMLFRHRVYDVETMRWMQQDPLGYVDGLNLHAYEVSSPATWVDPVGTDAYVESQKTDAGWKHARVWVEVRDCDGKVVGYLKGEFTQTEGVGNRPGAFVRPWTVILPIWALWDGISAIATKAQGVVEIGYRGSKSAEVEMKARNLRRVQGNTSQDEKLQKWILSTAGKDQKWLDEAISLGVSAYSHRPTSGPWAVYDAATNNCADYGEQAIDDYLGYNWSWEPMIMDGDDLLQQIDERFNTDGSKK